MNNNVRTNTVLYMPDGNYRYSVIHKLPLPETYKLGGETLKLFSEFFLVEQRMDMLIYHGLSDYSHERNDATLDSIYGAAIETFECLIDEDFFTKNGISFSAVDHSGKLPLELKHLVDYLTESTKNENDGEVVVLLGYSLKQDIEESLFQNPRNHNDFRNNLIFDNIDLVIRTCEMRPSGGPVYAMSQAQMMILKKYNPEITRDDLCILWDEYCKLKDYRFKSHK